MDFTWSEDQKAYRSRLVDFLEANLPDDWEEIYREGPAAKALTEFSMEFCPKLSEAGFLVPHWPREFGGEGGRPWEHYILGEELWGCGEPRGGQYMNVNWIGPTIMRFGSEEQKARYLPEMAAGKVIWCQGFSEPSSGSDLASLRTRADRDGDEFVVNGQKIWTTYAGLADHCFLLARTGSDRKKGISILLISMATPGITVRPIPALVGEGDLHEVFFDNVRVPASCLLGEPGEAWNIITYSLANERVGIARYAFSIRALDYMVKTLKSEGKFSSEAVRVAAARAYAACEAARILVYRIVDARDCGEPPSASSSLARSLVVEADNAVANFAFDYLPDRFSGVGDAMIVSHHERAIAAGLASGAAEIQLNIVAQQYLNLPREPRA